MKHIGVESALVDKLDMDVKSYPTFKRQNCIIVCIVVVVVNILLLFAMFAYTLCTVNDIKATSTKLRDELSILQSRCAVLEDDSEENEFQNRSPWPFHSKHRSKRENKNKKKEKPFKVPPFIHLVGRPGTMFTEGETKFFMWKSALDGLDPGIHGFELIGEPGVHKIRIKNQGVYIVYSQVAVHGRLQLTQPNECSHETVAQSTDKTKRVLLTSLVTQYQLGATYHVNGHNHSLRALDTKMHMGIFMLMKHDELWVQIPPSCGSMEYTSTDNNSYFGVADISSNWNKPFLGHGSKLDVPTTHEGGKPPKNGGKNKKG